MLLLRNKNDPFCIVSLLVKKSRTCTIIGIYCHAIDEIYAKLHQQQPALINRKDPIFLQNNARSHVSQFSIQKFNELKIEVLFHPPQSPDLSLTDYYILNASTTFLPADSSQISSRKKRQFIVDFIANPSIRFLL